MIGGCRFNSWRFLRILSPNVLSDKYLSEFSLFCRLSFQHVDCLVCCTEISLMQSNLSILGTSSHSLTVLFRISSFYILKCFIWIFLSCFNIWGLTLRYSIRLNWLVYCEMCRSSFILLHVEINGIISPVSIVSHMGLFLGLPFYPIDLYVPFCATAMLFYYYGSTI